MPESDQAEMLPDTARDHDAIVDSRSADVRRYHNRKTYMHMHGIVSGLSMICTGMSAAPLAQIRSTVRDSDPRSKWPTLRVNIASYQCAACVFPQLCFALRWLQLRLSSWICSTLRGRSSPDTMCMCIQRVYLQFARQLAFYWQAHLIAARIPRFLPRTRVNRNVGWKPEA